jgi:signal transduction histidine kinase
VADASCKLISATNNIGRHGPFLTIPEPTPGGSPKLYPDNSYEWGIVEPEDFALKPRRPWPTRNVFWNTASAMIGFGLTIGVVFPYFAAALGVSRDQVMSASFRAACLGAGALVGVTNYLLISYALRGRLRVLAARLSGAQREIVKSAGSDRWRMLAEHYSLPMDSNDEFGETVASFNYLMSSLDSSRTAENELRRSLVDQAKLAALGTLTAGVAHEVKNPLNFVMNFAELNLELCAELQEPTCDDRDELISDLEANLHLIIRHAERALAVMATMLQVGRAQGAPQPCHLNLIVEQSAALAAHSWRINQRKAHCAIHIDPDDADPVVTGYQGDLAQVMINLVTNALESASSITDRDTHVRITVRHDEASALVLVSDNGPGIDAEVLPHIFEPFFTTKHRRGGTGLGLSICKDIIDNRHHGELIASSTPGAGAEFSVRLPLEAVSAGVREPACLD